MQIDGWTLALQTVNFLILVWLLRRFLFLPVREIIERRKSLAEQAFSDADKQKAEAEVARQRFEEDRGELAQERQNLLKSIHEEQEAERRAAHDEATLQAEKQLAKARQLIAKERNATLVESREQASVLAIELATRFLGQASASAANDFFLAKLDQQLGEMSEDECARLKKDIASDEVGLTIVTATPLTTKDQQKWSERFGQYLGQPIKTIFACDPEILGGAELRFPHAVLTFSWKDQLDKTKEALLKNERPS